MLAQLPFLAINRLLNAQPWALARLKAHAGQSFSVQLASTRFAACVGQDGLLQPASAECSPDVSVSIPDSAWPSLLTDFASARQHVRVEGKAAFAETLQVLAQHLRPDLAADLAPYVGDILAQRISGAAERASRGVQQAAAGAGSAVLAYVRDEQRLLVSRAEMDAFRQDIDALGVSLSALAKRI